MPSAKKYCKGVDCVSVFYRHTYHRGIACIAQVLSKGCQTAAADIVLIPRIGHPEGALVFTAGITRIGLVHGDGQHNPGLPGADCLFDDILRDGVAENIRITVVIDCNFSILGCKIGLCLLIKEVKGVWCPPVGSRKTALFPPE